MDNHDKDPVQGLPPFEKKHSYPAWLLLGIFFVLFIYVISLVHFINYDIPLYKEFRRHLFAVRKYLDNDQQSLALNNLNAIFQNFPDSKLVQSREAKKLFETRKQRPESFCHEMLRLERRMRKGIESYL